MRLLHEIERRQRGVYTGAIGYISPNAEAEFNVAIRTVSLKKGVARLGVGAGITYGSNPAQEFAECLTKTAFLRHDPEPAFELIETLLLQDGSFVLLEEHLARMRQSAEYFDFIFHEDRVRSALEAVARSCKHAQRARVRLLLNKLGAPTCTAAPLEHEESASVDLLLSEVKTSAGDRFLRHKTTYRALYDSAVQDARSLGFADKLFQNTRNELTEGAIHNLIVSIAGEWFTPPLSCGVLPGIYRETLLQSKKVTERVLLLSDLLNADEAFVCNSVRGLRRVALVAEERNQCEKPEVIWRESERSSHACEPTAPFSVGSAPQS